MNLTRALTLLAIITARCFAQPAVDPRAFMPKEARLESRLQLDFENDGVSETVLVYGVPDKTNSVSRDVSIKVLKVVASKWSVVFEEARQKPMTPQDEFSLEKITSASGSDGAVIVNLHTGAGAVTLWHVLANLKGQIERLDPQPFKTQVLSARGYQDWGGNKVKVDKDLVIETVPGYSRKASRCCPDSAKLEIKFKFTGNALSLERIR